MHLNCHTYYSLKFGTMSPEELLREAAAKGVHKLVLTDINNTSGILDFHRLAPAHHIQPLAGIDFRNMRTASSLSKKTGRGFIGIAKNHEGFFELNNFLTKCLYEGEQGLTGGGAAIPDYAPEFEHVFIIYPFDSGETLKKENDFSSSVLRHPNSFIGIKPADLSRLRFSPWRDHPEKLVALAPATFRNQRDFNAHRLLRAMDNNTLLSKLPASEQASPDHILRSREHLEAIYKDFPFLIYNADKLLDECESINFEFEANKNKKYFLGNERDDYQLLEKLCEEGMRYRYPSCNDEIRNRYQKEIDVISHQKFTSYFLINWDIVDYARHKNYFYVGRGSGANSMVAYLLKITDVDPIGLDLYFERFINPSRKNPPDFDIDFSSDERDDVITHIFEKHGAKYTALLATYSEMKDNSVTRELGKVFGLPKAEIDALLDSRIHPDTPDHITRLIQQYGRHLYSFPSHLSIHAGGILISEKPIAYYTALSNPPKGFPLTQFSMQEAEDVGLYKFDILSQRGLGKVRDAVDIIRQNQKVKIDIHDVKEFMKDDDVRENLEKARLMGCFYVESPAMRMLLTKLRAKTYLDLVAASSIIRPGVAQSGMMQEYIRRFHDPGRAKREAIPELLELMEETFGVMVYQEDVIKVAHHFAGLSLGEADMLRRGMSGKYRARSEFQKVEQQFFSNCRDKGYDEAKIKEVWRQIESFAGYAFSKGHSASYAVESYQCMFLKTHYPLEYMVAVINNGGGFFAQEFYIHEARMNGATVHEPEINLSDLMTTIREKNIYLGFHLIAGLERNLQQKMVEERKRNGPFSSLANFMKRVSVAVEQLRILIRIGAFRFTGRTKQQLLWDIHTILGANKKSEARRELFESSYKNFQLPELDEIKFRDAIDAIEILGFPLQSPFQLLPQDRLAATDTARQKKRTADAVTHVDVASDLPRFKNRVIRIVGYYVTYKPTSTKKGEAMMFGCFLDRKGFFFDTNHFPEAARKYPFRGKGCYVVTGKVAEEFGFYSINVTAMEKIDYVMYQDDAETIARSKPDPVIVPPVVPASERYEYLLVINPPPHITHQVEALKKKFHQQFNHYQAVISKPHITLCRFVLTETKEPEIVKKISAETSQQSPFKIMLRGFHHFRTHTIFIRLEEPDDIVGLCSALKKQLNLSEKESFFTTTPSLAVAKDLDAEKFTRAFAVFQSMEYETSFIAGEALLLRRLSQSKKYDAVRRFRFEGKNILNRAEKAQLALHHQ